MHPSVPLYAVFVLFLAACTLTLANPEVHTTLGLAALQQQRPQVQKPLAALHSVSSYAFADSQPMQAASDAGSAERPIGMIAIAVVALGVLFGLGMGM